MSNGPSNVIQLADDHDVAALAKQRRIRNTIGAALGRAYPSTPWHVSVSGCSTAAQITCPKISTEYCMVIHCNGETSTVERKAVMMAGELLERFRVSRGEDSNFDHIARNIHGQAIHGKAGGV